MQTSDQFQVESPFSGKVNLESDPGIVGINYTVLSVTQHVFQQFTLLFAILSKILGSIKTRTSTLFFA